MSDLDKVGTRPGSARSRFRAFFAFAVVLGLGGGDRPYDWGVGLGMRIAY